MGSQLVNVFQAEVSLEVAGLLALVLHNIKVINFWIKTD